MERITYQDLVNRARSYEKSRDRWLVGAEFERALVDTKGAFVPYFGDRGVKWFLESFYDRYHWKPKYEGENLIELKGDPVVSAPAAPYLTLEPGSQVELSGAPYAKLKDIAAETYANKEAIAGIVAEGAPSLRWISVGLTPYAKIEEIPFVPKGRYAVMQKYLPAQGSHATWMMKGTCATQASFDFSDEADLNRKFQLITRIAPLTVAMFANSPIAEGKPTGWMSTRAWVWTRTDTARTGIPGLVAEGYSHEKWIQYLLDRPMMFYVRDGQWYPAHGRTFRSWMSEGLDGHFPSMADWELHQTSVFPEARVKSTVEIRSADAVSLPLGLAFCAYWKGLLYSETALDAGLDLASRLVGEGTAEERHLLAAKHGLRAQFGSVGAAELGRDLVDLARLGLRELGEDEQYLEPLAEVVASGRSPGEALLEALEQGPEAVVRVGGW